MAVVNEREIFEQKPWLNDDEQNVSELERNLSSGGGIGTGTMTFTAPSFASKIMVMSVVENEDYDGLLYKITQINADATADKTVLSTGVFVQVVGTSVGVVPAASITVDSESVLSEIYELVYDPQTNVSLFLIPFVEGGTVTFEDYS